jgi:hypothetical protein
MITAEKKAQINFELAQGKQAQKDGLDGRARVCARRATGIALRYYYSKHQPQLASLSVIDMIKAYPDHAQIPQNLQEICEHLLARVNKDYQLPFHVDILAEAQILIDAILEEDSKNP